MRRHLPLLVLASLLGCAGERAAGPGPLADAGAAGAPVLRTAELARVRCLLVAPLDNASDAPHAADAATGALAAEVDPARAKVLPIADLRALFRDTPLELPTGVGPSLALELASLVGADAALYGSVEGRSQDARPELLVTVRLSLASDHQLLFAQSFVVTAAPGERTDSAVRRAVQIAVGPVLRRLGDAGKKRCFDPERTKALRKLALAEAAEARAALAPAPVAKTEPPPAAAVPAAVPAAVRAAVPTARVAPAATKTPRQAELAKRLDAGARFVLEEVAFAGRSADLQRDAGLADLAGALAARPDARIRVEGFVDATNDHGADQKLSASMAKAAALRLADLGIARQRVTWGGRGGESPRLPNFTARGRAANRRIEVVAVQ